MASKSEVQSKMKENFTKPKTDEKSSTKEKVTKVTAEQKSVSKYHRRIEKIMAEQLNIQAQKGRNDTF